MFFSSRKRQKVSKERKRGKLFPEKFIKGFVCYPSRIRASTPRQHFSQAPRVLFYAPTQSRSDLRKGVKLGATEARTLAKTECFVKRHLSLWFFLPWRKNIKPFLIFPQIKPRCEATNRKSNIAPAVATAPRCEATNNKSIYRCRPLPAGLRSFSEYPKGCESRVTTARMILILHIYSKKFPKAIDKRSKM